MDENEYDDVQINEYRVKMVSLFLEPVDLTTLFNYCVSSQCSSFVGCIFRQDRVLVDYSVHYIEFLNSVIQQLDIVPIWDLNEGWRKCVKQLDRED